MDKKTLQAMYTTLNSVTVQGEENLDKLLACLQTIKQELKDIAAAEQQPEQQTEQN